MARLKPYSGTSHDRLTALINSGNQTQLVENVDFTFGTPSSVVAVGGRNTAIAFNPTNYQVYGGQILRYKRRPLTDLSQLAEGEILPVVITAVPFSIHGILPAINEALGLNLVTSEVVNTTYATVNASYALKIVDNFASLGWLESTFNFVANHQNSRTLEDGTVRLLEDGSVRLLEVQVTA